MRVLRIRERFLAPPRDPERCLADERAARRIRQRSVRVPHSEQEKARGREHRQQLLGAHLDDFLTAASYTPEEQDALSLRQI